jgi:hypothetical protein
VSVVLALLPSPLLGPVAWEPVAASLRATGHSAVAVDLPPEISTPEHVLRHFADTVGTMAGAGGHVVLVPHSNAGLYAPAVAASAGALGTVFVDAALPPADAGSTTMAPAPLYEHLAGLADAEGLLPPWTRWWDDADVSGLFPTPESRRLVEAVQPRLPLTYFESRLEVPAGWARRPCGYVAFGDTYAEETAVARRHGWHVRRLDGGHLQMLHEPDTVARTVVELTKAFGGSSPDP